MSYKLYRERAGVISNSPCWVLIDHEGAYMYTAGGFLELITLVYREWKFNKHFIG